MNNLDKEMCIVVMITFAFIGALISFGFYLDNENEKLTRQLQMECIETTGLSSIECLSMATNIVYRGE